MTEADFMLPQDKANHVVYGAGFFIAFVLLVSPGWALLWCAVVAAGKEASDWLLNRQQVKHAKAPTHDPSPWDFLATCCGGVGVYCAVMFHAV